MLDTSKVDFNSIYRRYDIESENFNMPESIVSRMLPKNPILRNIAMAVTYVRFREVGPAVMKALQFKIDPQTIVNEGLVTGMEIVSYLYAHHIYYLPEIIMASKVMELGISIAEKVMTEELATKGKIVMHVAEGDPHDIGKNIAASMLKSSGYSVIDLGKDVTPEEVIDAVCNEKPMMVTGTALMTVTLSAFPKTAKALADRGIDIPYMVAGGAVNRDFAESFDMGIYSKKAPQTIPIADSISNGSSWREIRESWDDIVEGI